MGPAHIRYKAIVRLADAYKFLDVIRMAGAHLDYGKFRPVIDRKDGKGHADVIVQIAFCGRYVVLGGQHPRNQFLGGRLPVGSCKAYDRKPPAVHEGILPVMAGKGLQCLQGIRNCDHSGIP